MARELGRRQLEDQPSLARVDGGETENVAEEGPGSLRVLGEDDGVRPGDHETQSKAPGAAPLRRGRVSTDLLYND